VRSGDRLVRVAWGTGAVEAGEATGVATPEQASALKQLDARLTDPASWLPASAWEDREIRAYVPSRYEVCIESWTKRSIELTRISALLPTPAQDRFSAIDWTPEERSATGGYCSDATLAEARAPRRPEPQTRTGRARA
jgi:hypothetical protein